jgi:hypothetical protein
VSVMLAALLFSRIVLFKDRQRQRNMLWDSIIHASVNW